MGESRRRANPATPAVTSTRRNAASGSDLPLTSSGGTGSATTASRTRRRVSSPMRTVPGSAACSRRAATFTASPVTSVSACSPATTSPVFTPIRAASETPWSRSSSLFEGLEGLSHLDRGANRSKGIVLVDRRDPEHRHHRVPDELLHGAPVTLQRRPHLGEVAGHDPAERLGVEALAHGRRARDVAEDHRHGLALLVASGRRARATPRTPGRTQASSGILTATVRAGQHEWSLRGTPLSDQFERPFVALKDLLPARPGLP